MKTLKLKENLYWVGALDPDLRVFDIIMNTKFGTTYNSYLIKGEKKTALVETVKIKFFDEFIEKLNEVSSIDNIDFIVVDHTEPDHAGSIEKLVTLNPNITVVGSRTALDFLKNICNVEFKAFEVKSGDGLELGGKTLRFIDAKFLHWPDSMYSYLEEDKVLFTCDSFGSHYSLDTVLQSTVKNYDDYLEAFKYYYDNILGPFKVNFLDAIKKVEELDIDMICPGHGPVLDEDPWKIVKLSKEYSTYVNPNKNLTVVITYVSAYGYTGMIAEALKKAVESKGIDVKMFDLVTDSKADAEAEILHAEGLLFGSPTILSEALKPIWDVLTDIYFPIHKGKLASAFGSYGWSGEAVPNIMARLKQIKLKTFKDGIRIRFKPSEAQLKEVEAFGLEFADEIIANYKK